MKLFITGGGDSENFEEIDQEFIRSLGDNPTLLYIPLAQEQELWESGLGRIKEVFSTIHFNNIEMCSDLSELSWELISRFSAIYIDGGNTFDLMSEIHHTHTYELLKKYLHKGGVINGDSAGAIVLGSHLQTAHFGEEGDDNDAEVISYQGLNFLGDWAIHCHYNENEDSEIMDFSDEYGFPILALHEDSSIKIENKEISVIGKRKISIFKGSLKTEIFPGQKYILS